MLLEISVALASGAFTSYALYLTFKAGIRRGQTEGYTLAAVEFERLVNTSLQAKPQQLSEEKEEQVSSRGNTFSGKASKLDN